MNVVHNFIQWLRTAEVQGMEGLCELSAHSITLSNGLFLGTQMAVKVLTRWITAYFYNKGMHHALGTLSAS